jgi:predicted dienelactone hydrolase
VGAVLSIHPRSAARWRLLRVGLFVALAVVSGLAAPAPAAGLPDPGPAPFTTLDMEWLDTARNRLVPVRRYLPTAADSEHPVPLVVFSHGIGGSRAGYSYLGTHWASRGLASLHLQHVGGDRSLWTGNPFGLPGRLQDAAQECEAVARVGDLTFALGRLLGGQEGPRIDRQHIAAAGHSYGAKTTLLAIGAHPGQGHGTEPAHRRDRERDPHLR